MFAQARPRRRRRTLPTTLEVLEGRQLLATGVTVVPVKNPVALVGDGSGTVYFAQGPAGEVGWVDAQGKVHEVALPPGIHDAAGIANIGFGEFAFTEPAAHEIGMLDADGQIAEFSLPTRNAQPGAIAGNFDFAAFSETVDNPKLPASKQVNQIGEISQEGDIEEYPLPPGVEADALTVGSSGVWFVDRPANEIGRLGPTGVVTLFKLPTNPGQLGGGATGLGGIAAGADGNLWFTELQSHRIGRLTPGGQFTFYATTAPNAYPTAITAGPDGDLWFTESTATGAEVGRISPANGSIVNIGLPAGFVAPVAIAADGPGAVALADPAGNRIGIVPTNPHAGFEILTSTPGQSVLEFQGVAAPSISLGSFTTNLSFATAADFHATISWGDGTTSTGIISPEPSFYYGGGLTSDIITVSPPYPTYYYVSGAHTYEHAGNYAIHVTIADAFGLQTGMTTSATVSGKTFVLEPATPVRTYLQGLNSFFQLSDLFAPPSTLSQQTSDKVTIHWGDGTTSAGDVEQMVEFQTFDTFIPSGVSNFDGVDGLHDYARAGTYTVTYTVTDKSGDTQTGQTQVQILSGNVNTPSISSSNPNFLAGIPETSAVVAYISEPSLTNVAGISESGVALVLSPSEISTKNLPTNDSATIDWGDGTSSAGKVINSPFDLGSEFELVGNHTYTHIGVFPLKVTIKGIGIPTQTLTGLANVTSASQFEIDPGVYTVPVKAGLTESVSLPGFSTERPGARPSDYSVVINWGDGLPPSRGVVNFPSFFVGSSLGLSTTNFTITAPHKFARVGTYEGEITITQNDGKTSQELVEFDAETNPGLYFG